MTATVRDMVRAAGRQLGWLAAGEEPDADDGVIALAGWNRLKRAMFGTVIGPRLSALAMGGTSGQAETGGEYMIPGGAAFTIAAPSNPRSGARFGVVDAALAWGAYPLTIRPNGRLIAGSAANVVVGVAGANARYWFRGDAGDWIVEADSAALDSVVEFPDSLTAYLPMMLAVAIAADFSSEIRPEVMSLAVEGRLAFARAYGRRGLAQIDAPLGAPPAIQGA